MWFRKKDETLKADVGDELFWDPSIDSSNVTIFAQNGVVTLTGTVPTYAMKVAAAREAERVSGVCAVVQHLNVQLPDSHRRSDGDLARAATTALQWDVEVPTKGVKATVENGIITLGGEVEWNYQREAAERAVRNLAGVVFVLNQIGVTPIVKVKDVRDRIAAALERSAETDATNISIGVEGSTVTLSGTVQSWSEREEARRAAWSAPGVRNVHDTLSIAA